MGHNTEGLNIWPHRPSPLLLPPSTSCPHPARQPPPGPPSQPLTQADELVGLASLRSQLDLPQQLHLDAHVVNPLGGEGGYPDLLRDSAKDRGGASWLRGIPT